MKKTIIAVAVIAFIGIGIYLLTASQQKIVGTWKELGTKDNLQTRFNADGSAVSIFNGDVINLKWIMTDSILTMTFLDNNKTAVYKVKFDNNTMTLSDGKYPPATLIKIK